MPVTKSQVVPALEPREGRVRFGLIALATDLTSERDLISLLPQDCASVHTTRVAYDNPTTPESLAAMAPRLGVAADLLVPGEELAGICYSCTAASVVIGDEAVTGAIQEMRPGVPVITPTGAARLALEALGAWRIAVLTPYTIETSEPMAAYFETYGFAISNFQCLGLDDDREMARVERASIVEAAIAVDTAAADALFISCTALPAIGAIGDIEQRIGKPVVTSNQASGWAMSRTGGFANHRPAKFGRLFGLALPARSI